MLDFPLTVLNLSTSPFTNDARANVHYALSRKKIKRKRRMTKCHAFWVILVGIGIVL
jgi:hypothetical protein